MSATVTPIQPVPLSEMLAQRRKELGLSIEQAAVSIKTNSNTYRAWERGTERPEKLKWIRPLASWLDVPTYRVSAALDVIGEDEYSVLRDALGGYLADAA